MFKELIRHFAWPIGLSIAVLAIAFDRWGPGTTGVVALLALLELVFSIDNAIVNAKFVGALNGFWRRLFLTVGVAIAVFGMRLLFPFLILAVFGSGEAAGPSVAAFGLSFLAPVGLNNFLLEPKEEMWFPRIETRLAALGERFPHLGVVLVAVALPVIAFTAGRHSLAGDQSLAVLGWGYAGLALYAGIGRLTAKLMKRQGGVERRASSAAKLSGRTAGGVFLYLEAMDATFSLDGVIGALAITHEVVPIAIGLGIGALFVRSLTVVLVRKNALGELPFLEHGAHFAILTLAVVMAFSIAVHVPEAVGGLAGIGFSAVSLFASVRFRRKQARTAQ